MSLTNAHYSTIALEKPVDENTERRGRPQRVWAISDMKYKNNKLLVTGLSNQEFGSTFRSIPFPFKGDQDYASLEIYHAAHGQYETFAPIKTFNFVTIKNKEYVIASYTCTPLVLFPIDALEGKKHVKGRTVAELGAGSSPLDMITFNKKGVQHFFMSNSNRPVMRFNVNDLEAFSQNLSTPVDDFGATAGIVYDSLPFVNILQMDDLDAENVVFLQRTSDGDLVLRNRSKEWM